MAEQRYNTNLASEFHVLSTLHRLGANATLTLGNRKSVDIVVVRDNGRMATIDVKGLAGKTAWPVDNLTTATQGHYVVFVASFFLFFQLLLALPHSVIMARTSR